MSQSLDLYRLQSIDAQRDQACARVKEIERIMNEDRRVIEATELVNRSKRDLENTRRRLHQAEENVQSQTIKIEETEAALYSGRVRNPKELQDLQNEVAALKRHLETLENNQLEIMIAVEKAEEAQAKVEETLNRLLTQVKQEQAGLLGEREHLQRDLERLENEHAILANSIPDQSRQLYERLRQQKRGLAVARVTENACSACGTTLTPAEWQAARAPHQISLCPTCGRILYAG